VIPDKAATLKSDVTTVFKISFPKFGGIQFILFILFNHNDTKSVKDFEDKTITRNQGISIS